MSDFQNHAQLKNFVQVATEVMTEFCKARFEFPDEYKINTRVYTKAPRSRKTVSNAIGHIWSGDINFRVHSYLTRTYFSEYDHIKHDPIIGEFDGTQKKITLALVAHEVAHCIVDTFRSIKNHEWCDEVNGNVFENDYGLGDDTFDDDAIDDVNDHGPFWQAIYRILREEFVNSDEALSKIAIPEIKKVKRQTQYEEVIGEVTVAGFTWWKNHHVQGTFPVLRKFTESKASKECQYRVTVGDEELKEGTIIIKFKGQQARVNVQNVYIKETLYA